MSGPHDPLPGPAAKLPLLDLRKVEQSHLRQQVEAVRRLQCLVASPVPAANSQQTCLVVLCLVVLPRACELQQHPSCSLLEPSEHALELLGKLLMPFTHPALAHSSLPAMRPALRLQAEASISSPT